MTLSQDLSDTIVIIISLDLLHKNFKITTSSQFMMDDKTIDKIQKIFQSKEAKNLSKQVIKDIITEQLFSKIKNRKKSK